MRELERRGLRVEHEKRISFEFDGLHFVEAFRLDLVVGGIVIVELKSVEQLAPVHQLLTYLRLLKFAKWTTDSFRRSDIQGRRASHRQQLLAFFLRVFAAPRE